MSDSAPKNIARVVLFRGMDRELFYEIENPDDGRIRCGSMVRVPLRGGMSEGIVAGIGPLSPEHGGFKMKKIHSPVQDEPVLTPDLVDLAFWMRDYYACGVQTVLESMVPAVVRAGKGAARILEISLGHPPGDAEMDKLRLRAPRQAEVLKFMAARKSPMPKSALLKTTECPQQAVDSLVKKGFLKQGERELTRAAFDDELSRVEMVSSSPHELNAEQKLAFEQISEDLASGEFRTRLLYGVTGSGKTEIYMRAMKDVLDAGGSCVFLVPEIALTPQTVGRLKSRLGNSGLVVWHSGLSDGQRLDAWRALARGEARVVVGARSCVFAPVENLRLVIVDEEHDGAYKQDKAPRYNARDMAVYRAKLTGAVCVLGSATPSLESLANAKNGKYAMSRITSRVDGRKMPLVYIADMKREKAGTMLSGILAEKLAKRLDDGEQSILFLNRRGYSKIFECPDCGETEQCPHCSMNLTWHKKENVVKCHLCGYTARAPSACRKCGSKNAKWSAHGTQKLEDVVAAMFPSARIGRMDRDTMKRSDNYRRILGDFRSGKLDILIGTQMIAKGLDFPRVTLAGIVNADISLHMPDFRAAERTYQLLVQVAGRAGRGDGAGEVVVQTMQPDAAPIQYAKHADMDSFLEEELEARAQYSYPPFSHIVRQIFRSKNRDKLEFYAAEWAKYARKPLSKLCTFREPAPAPLEKSEDYYRWHICYFCRSAKALAAKITELRRNFEFDADIDEYLDVDPVSMI